LLLISGGVDSAVTSTLCAQTTAASIMCDAHTKHKSCNEDVSIYTKIDYNVCSIEADLSSVLTPNCSSRIEDTKLHLALANTRARLHTTLYYFAGIHGLLVAGTGNKVEDFGGRVLY
jgi:NAD+ synthase